MSGSVVISYLKDPDTKALMTAVIDELLGDYDVHPEGLAQAVIDKQLQELQGMTRLELSPKEVTVLEEILEDGLRDEINEAIWPELETITVKLASGKEG